MAFVEIPYTPRPQFLPYHDRKQRWAVGVAHRRAGKTVACVNELIKAAALCDKQEPRFAYVAPYYAQAKDIAWSYFKKFGMCIPNTIANESELRLDFPNGGRIRLYGADNYDRLRGIYLDGVVLDEYGDMDPRAWSEAIRPALSDRIGWATFIGTPKGQNHFAELWDKAESDPDWLTFMLKASQTGILIQSELEAAKKEMTAEQFAAEFECSFYGSVVGAYYGQEIDWLESSGYIGAYAWNPSLAVYTAWDPGATTAIWFFQIDGGIVRVIDYLEGHNQRSDWYAGKLREKPYSYATHFMPFDASVEKEIIAESWQSSLQKLGFYNTQVLPQERVKENGINAAKMLLPRCRFNRETTDFGVKSLRNYRREWDDKRKTFREHPLHDWSSHGADAFRYAALAVNSGISSDGWTSKIEYRNFAIA